MFGWFQRLLPQSGDFFTMFERHSAACVAASEALAQLVNGEGERQAHISAIRDREHDADDVIRQVLAEVRQTFLTPFDRTAIIGLIGAMDDVVDEIQACASAVELYDFRDFEPEMRSMAAVIVSAVKTARPARGPDEVRSVLFALRIVLDERNAVPATER